MDNIESSLNFGPVSVILILKNLVQEVTKCPHEVFRASWSLLLCQTQEFLNELLARFPITPNPQGTHEMIDEVLSSISAQDMDTSGYQVPDMDDVDFYWENDQLDVDNVFRPSIDTSFPPAAFNDSEMGASVEDDILLDEEEDNENSTPTTPASERLTRSPALLSGRHFGTKKENVPDSVYRTLLR